MKSTFKSILFPIELTTGCGAFLLWLFLLRPLLCGQTTLWHDNLYWHLPLFHYFAEALLQGVLPLWSPFSHGGEPFWPMALQFRLIEPLTVMTILGGGVFTKNILLLFHWDRIVRTVWMLVGIYWFFRPQMTRLTTKVALQVVLFFSAVTLGSFRSDAYLSHFIWAPYIALFLRRIKNKDSGFINVTGLALAVGLNFQSYFFAFPLLFLILFPWVLGGGLPSWKKILPALPILFILALPNVAAFIKQKEFVFPARFLPKNYQQIPSSFQNPAYSGGEYDDHATIGFDYSAVTYGGSFSSAWDYLQLIAPEGNPWIYGKRTDILNHFGTPSEAFLFIGISAWAICLIGFFSHRDPTKYRWLVMSLLFVVISLGPQTPFYRPIFLLFPPLWFLRHTQFAAPYFLFCLLYFFICGLESLSISRKSIGMAFLIFFFHVAAVYSFHPDPKHFLFRVTLFGVGSFLLLRTPWVIALLLLELPLRFLSMDTLYASIASPYQTIGVSPLAQKFVVPAPRELTPYYPPIPLWGSQRPRYLSHLYRKPFIFSRVIRSNETDDPWKFGMNTMWWDALAISKTYFSALRENPKKSELGLGQPFSPNTVTEYSPNTLRLYSPTSQKLRLYQSNSQDWTWVTPNSRLKPLGDFYQEALVPAGETRMEYRPWPIIISYLLFVWVGSALPLGQVFYVFSKLKKALLDSPVQTGPDLITSRS